MITGLTAKEAADLVKTHRCACNGILVDCWGGSFGVKGPVVRCLNDLEHSTLKPRDPNTRKLLNGQTNEWEDFDVQTQKRVDPGALAVYQTDHGQLELSVGQIIQYLCPTATREEAYLFLCLCQAQRLNPLIKEAYLVVFVGKDGTRRVSMIVARDVFIRRAEAHPKYAGFEAGITVELDSGNVEEIQGALVPLKAKLLGGWSKVYRSDRQQPHYTTISYGEYTTGQSTWNKMPGTMCRKVALVQGFRETFPTISVGMDSNVVVGDPGEEVEGEVLSDSAAPPPQEAPSAPSTAAPTPAPTAAAPQGQRQPRPAGYCQGHRADMFRSSSTKKVAHVLGTGEVCAGVPVVAPPPPVGEGTPPYQGGEDLDDGATRQGESADLPPSQGQDEAELRAAVESAKLAWDKFEFTVLQMRWGIWLQKKHTVAEARARLDSYMRTPQAS